MLIRAFVKEIVASLRMRFIGAKITRTLCCAGSSI